MELRRSGALLGKPENRQNFKLGAVCPSQHQQQGHHTQKMNMSQIDMAPRKKCSE